MLSFLLRQFLKSNVKKEDLKRMCTERSLSDKGTVSDLSNRLADYEFKMLVPFLYFSFSATLHDD